MSGTEIAYGAARRRATANPLPAIRRAPVRTCGTDGAYGATSRLRSEGPTFVRKSAASRLKAYAAGALYRAAYQVRLAAYRLQYRIRVCISYDLLRRARARRTQWGTYRGGTGGTLVLRSALY
eukprot:2150173-Rhodomonas_salina.2